ncbi:MAG: serine/threonine protein kinase [Candidatus Riflebacteria bacterium]|nr:serine/threonine protein kinase [Candidatus Riflebacteria bacterium]
MDMENGVPPDCLSRIKPIRLIARGGFGAVYFAHQTSLDRTVALKVLLTRSTVGGTEAERFIREARIAASLNHPAIVRVWDFGAEAGTPWIAYEYVDGPTLKERLIEVGHLPASQVIDVGVQVAGALSASHEAGILHRDVKPGNILVASVQPCRCKLTDFGLAKWIDVYRTLTREGEMVGSPPYMAPEYIKTGAVSASVDVYALGVTLFELLTGRRPFESTSPLEMIMLQVDAPVPAASTIRPGIDPRWDGVLRHALEKEPSRRHRSAAELAADLEQLRPPPRAEPKRPRPAGPLQVFVRRDAGGAGGHGAIRLARIAAAVLGTCVLVLVTLRLLGSGGPPSPLEVPAPARTPSATVAARPLVWRLKDEASIVTLESSGGKSTLWHVLEGDLDAALREAPEAPSARQLAGQADQLHRMLLDVVRTNLRAGVVGPLWLRIALAGSVAVDRISSTGSAAQARTRTTGLLGSLEAALRAGRHDDGWYRATVSILCSRAQARQRNDGSARLAHAGRCLDEEADLDRLPYPQPLESAVLVLRLLILHDVACELGRAASLLKGAAREECVGRLNLTYGRLLDRGAGFSRDKLVRDDFRRYAASNACHLMRCYQDVWLDPLASRSSKDRATRQGRALLVDLGPLRLWQSRSAPEREGWTEISRRAREMGLEIGSAGVR